MSGKKTSTIRTLQSKSPDPVGVFFPDLSTVRALELEAAANTQFPPTTEGGLWYLYIPAGKTAWLINEPMNEQEELDFALVQLRGLPITGPIYFPIAFDEGDYGYLVPEGASFDAHIVRIKNEGGAA